MKIITANNKTQIKMSRSEWEKMGREAGWFDLKLQDSYGNIPEHMLQSLNLYVKKGVPVGDFLTAVLSNDLFEAVGRADNDNNVPATRRLLKSEAKYGKFTSRDSCTVQT